MDSSSAAPRRGLAIFVLLTALLAGCGAESERPSPIRGLHSRLVTDADRLVVPGRGWRYGLCEVGAWGLGSRSSLWLWFAEEAPIDEELVLRLVGRPVDAGTPLAAIWAGDEEIVQGFDVGADGVLEIRVPAELLRPGLHRLRLERPPSADGAPPEPLCFRQLRWSQGDREAGVSAANRERLAYLEAFLSRGVGGLDHRKLGGTLFLGPGRLEESLSLEAPGTLRFELENASEREARFVARTADGDTEVTVPPRQRRPLVLPLAAGATELVLESEGADDGLFLWGAPRLETEPPADRPPVIVVTLDTTRRDVLSLYGDPEAAPTPSLDALADVAIVYDRAVATSPWTLPSHASLFTGLYPSRHGAGVWYDHLRAEYETTAERFRDAGYATAGFVGGWMATSGYGLGQGFGLYVNPPQAQERGDRLVDGAIAWVEEHRAMPFFLFLNLFDPHALFEPPEPWRSRFGLAELEAGLEDPHFRAMAAGDENAWARIIDGRSSPGEAELEWLRTAYRAEVAFTDAQLGRLFDVLREHGLFDRALIVVTSDHGELLGERGWYSHGSRLDPELIDVPLIVKWPGQSEGGRSSSAASLVDLHPTLLSVLAVDGEDEPLEIDGRRLSRSGESSEAARRLLFEEHQSVVHLLYPYMAPALHQWGAQEGDLHQAVWRGGGECARRSDAEWSPTDCPDDTEETRRAIVDSLGRAPSEESGDDGGAALDPEEREMLEALGYLPPEE